MYRLEFGVSYGVADLEFGLWNLEFPAQRAGHVVQNFVSEFLHPKVEASGKRLQEIADALDSDRQNGAITPDEHEILAERLGNLGRLQKRLSRAGSLAKRLL